MAGVPVVALAAVVRLAAVEEDDLRDLVEMPWRSLAPKRLPNNAPWQAYNFCKPANAW